MPILMGGGENIGIEAEIKRALGFSKAVTNSNG